MMAADWPWGPALRCPRATHVSDLVAEFGGTKLEISKDTRQRAQS